MGLLSNFAEGLSTDLRRSREEAQLKYMFAHLNDETRRRILKAVYEEYLRQNPDVPRGQIRKP